MTTSTGAGRIKGLDGVRAIAAVAVVFCHTVAGKTQIGGYAVDLFFALSGFLILKILYDARLAMEAGRLSFAQSLHDFWMRRVLRICPVYYIVAAIALSVLVAYHLLAASDVIYFVTYTQNFLQATRADWLPFGYTWTLAVEQQFYLLAAPVMLLIPSHRHRLTLWGVAVGLFGVFAGLVLAGVDGNIIFRLPLTGFFLAAAGGALAIGGFHLPPGIGFVRPYLTPGIIAITVVLAAFPVSFFAARTVLNLLQNTFMAIGLPSLIALIAEDPDTAIVGLLESRLLKFYGAISYSLYLIHGELAAFMKTYWPHLALGRLAFPVERGSLFIAVLGVSTGLAWLSYTYIEKTFTRLSLTLIKTV